MNKDKKGNTITDVTKILIEEGYNSEELEQIFNDELGEYKYNKLLGKLTGISIEYLKEKLKTGSLVNIK